MKQIIINYTPIYGTCINSKCLAHCKLTKIDQMKVFVPIFLFDFISMIITLKFCKAANNNVTII